MLETYNDQQWLENFEYLCRELERHLKPNESFVRAPVDVKKQVAIDIYLLGSSAEYRTIENLFGVIHQQFVKLFMWCVRSLLKIF